jgi:plastocyanin
MRRFLAPAIAALILAAAACNSSSSMYGGGSCNGSNSNISVCDNYYSPANATITSGSTITWTWRGTTGHSVTFQTGPVVPSGSTIKSSGMFQTTFNTPGTYTYQCLVHGAAMSGTIHVN